MMRTSRMIALFTLLGAGCGLFDRDDSSEPLETDGDEVTACVDSWSEFLAADACESPYFPMFTGSFDGDTIFWVDDAMNATTVGPGGWLFGTITTSDWVGYLLEGDVDCGIACVAPPGHPCSNDENLFCTAGEAAPGCTVCGPLDGITLDACDTLIPACIDASTGGGGGGGSADSTGTGGGEGGQVDSSSGGSEIAPPSDELFTQNPDLIFGGTEYLVGLYGSNPPPNLTTDDACTHWDPQAAVQDWFGEAILEKETFDAIVAEAETVLGYCDRLTLAMLGDGVEITSAEERTLAHELGFRKGDVLLSLNGVPVTDVLALRDEIMHISQANPGLARVLFVRGARKTSMTVRVQ